MPAVRAIRAAARVAFVAALLLGAGSAGALPRVAVGSKAFPESWILGAALATLVDTSGAAVAEHKKNLGGTEITYQALKTGNIDVYPEYTGTLSEVILKAQGRLSHAELRKAVADLGLGLSEPLGFNDGYALAVTKNTAERLRLAKI
jgi:osmoprotectant transport system permease protein